MGRRDNRATVSLMYRNQFPKRVERCSIKRHAGFVQQPDASVERDEARQCQASLLSRRQESHRQLSERRQIKGLQSRFDVAASMQRCPEREILTHGQRGFRGIVVPHIVDVSAMGRRIVTAIDTTVANGTLCRNAKPGHQAQQTCFAAPVSSRKQ